MAPSISTVEDILATFPQSVPTIDSEPNYDSIKATYQALKANSANIPTSLGGGNHGHLGLVLDPAVYHILL